MWLLISAARAQDPSPSPSPDPRDDDIFGTPAPAPEPEPAAPAPAETRDDSVLGTGFTGSETRLDQTLQKLDDRLTIGGRLWLQTDAYVPEGANGAEDVRLDSPNYLDLFADARPNDRVRGYAQARLQHDWTVRAGETDPYSGAPIPTDSVLLDQLYLKFDVAKRVFVTAGKQHVRWGTGRFWNPTDFLNQQRLDPLAIEDLRTGVDLLKLHLPFEAAGANVYAVANLQDAQALDQIGGAARAEWAFGSSEVSASAAARKDQPVQLGGDLSSGVGPFDLHAELAVQHGANGPFFAGPLDPATLQLPHEVDRSDEWLPQVVAGAEVQIRYSAEDSVLIGAEYFHNDLGYPDAHLYPWLFGNGGFHPLYAGRDYVAGSVALLALGPNDDQNLTGGVIANLSDKSALARVTWQGTALTWLFPTAFVGVHFGESGELHYRVPKDLAALAGTLNLPVLPAPLLDLGLGAVIRF